MGVLIRSLQTGRAAGTLKTEPILAAYFGNVRSILEYCCVIWGGAAQTHLERLDRIQHKFLMWLAAHVHTSRPSITLSYHDLLTLFKIGSLSQRRYQYDVCFIHKIIMGKIDSAFLLGSLPFHVPQRRTRGALRLMFLVPFGRVETVKRGVFVRALHCFNDFTSKCPTIDPFNTTCHSFKATVVKFIKQHPF